MQEFGRLVGGKLVVAAIVLLVGVIIARLVERLVHYVLARIEINRALRKVGLPFALEETVSGLVKYGLYFVAIIVTLNRIGFAQWALNITAGFGIVVILVSIVLGMKDFVPNYWAGFHLYRGRFYAVGDTIEVDGIEGVVTRFTVLDTAIRTARGDLLYLPSSLLLHSRIQKKH